MIKSSISLLAELIALQQSEACPAQADTAGMVDNAGQEPWGGKENFNLFRIVLINPGRRILYYFGGKKNGI